LPLPPVGALSVPPAADIVKTMVIGAAAGIDGAVAAARPVMVSAPDRGDEWLPVIESGWCRELGSLADTR